MHTDRPEQEVRRDAMPRDSGGKPRVPGGGRPWTRRATIADVPPGLLYHPGFVTDDEHADYVRRLAVLDYGIIQMRGQVAKRTVRHYGLRYDYDSWALVPTDPLPDWLDDLRNRAAALADVEPERFAQTLVTRYPPGAPIGWHRDAPTFGPVVVGVSFGSACRMRFQRAHGGVRSVHEIDLAPGSAYVLAGQARSTWQHSIPPVRQLRYSVTFRTLRRAA